jgi:flagellar protein FliO/FliZ
MRRRLITVAIILAVAIAGLILINTDPVSAERASTETPVPITLEKLAGGGSVTGGSLTAASSLLKILSALVIVVACIYGGVYVLKRLMNRRNNSRNGQQLLEVLETAYVGPKRTVSLIRVADKTVLVGVTESNISALIEFTAEETEAIVAVEPAQQLESDGFRGAIAVASQKLKEIGLIKNKEVLKA